MLNKKKDLPRVFRDKLFFDMLEELNNLKSDDVDLLREWYEEMDGAPIILILVARELYQITNDMDELKEHLRQIIELNEQEDWYI